MKEKFVLYPISLEELENLIKRSVKEGLTTEVNLKALKEESNDEFLTTKEAAQYLHVTTVSIHNWKRDKGLLYHRVGSNLRFKKSELDEFARLKNKKRDT